MMSRVLEHLDALVSFDTRNPPRAIGADGIFDYLCEALPGFRIELSDHGAGAVSLLAVRGETSRVFNVHLDTVPDSPAWTASPHRLRVTSDKAIGLGACDIKGAAACLLTAAENTQGPAAFLFTTDEEANDAPMHRRFSCTRSGIQRSHCRRAHPGASGIGTSGHCFDPHAI